MLLPIATHRYALLIKGMSILTLLVLAAVIEQCDYLLVTCCYLLLELPDATSHSYSDILSLPSVCSPSLDLPYASPLVKYLLLSL